MLSGCLAGGCSQKTGIEDLRCEYLVAPQGVDVNKPRFSWLLKSSERAVYQDAYRIIVSDNMQSIRDKRGVCWDTDVVQSDNTVNIRYEGSALASNSTYYWRVCSYLNGKEYWSQPAEFHTGMLKPTDWAARWISTAEEIESGSPLFRKEFTVEKAVDKAFIYSSAAGFYELRLNGAKVGLDVLNPAITDYRKTALYAVYDITEQLKKGGNAIGVMLGNGAYNMRRVRGRYSWGDSKPIGNPCFIIQLNIKYKDGTEAVITSDGSWRYTSGFITFNNIYGGEDCDARLEVAGWDEAGLDDAKWRQAVETAGPGGQLAWQRMSIRVTETVKPVAATRPSKGVYLFDLGQNIAGWWRIELSGAAGKTLRIRGSETLNNALFPKALEEGDRLSDKFRYHSHVWTDYTPKSNDTEIYEPRFFYSGFRYIEVAVSDSTDLADLKVEGRVVGSALERTGRWSSSNELLNSIYEAGVWSQRGNIVGYPTDCPHREKGAYNGDGQVIAETSMHDFNMAPFYAKWLNDMRESQEPSGRIPNTSPPIVGGMGGGVAWGSAYILIPWWMYHYYNDIEVMEEHYPAMKTYLAYLQNLARTDSKPDEPYIINYFDGYWYSLGEWCSPALSDCPNHDVVNTFYYYYDARLMSEIATVLGYSDDAIRFKALSDTVATAFISRFYNPETGIYGVDSVYQTYQLLALEGGLFPAGERDKVMQTIVDDIEARDNHLNTGIVGTKYLWSALSDAGYGELAYKIATQETYPSFGYWIRNNSTTLLEKWEGTDSHNHQMFGSITEYFYQYLAGIRAPARGSTTAGYRHITLQPYLPEGLQRCEARIRTASGEIYAGWKRQNNQYQYIVSIPANTAASVVLPVGDAAQASVVEGGKAIWQNGTLVGNVEGIDTVEAADGQIIVSIRSGSYSFAIADKK
ncbi:MAG: glycoside hydrolase family 78 protein [Tannerella sp.]|nr:glycoside hydrolase family 78 protein [Tannerella sp.]